MVNQQHQTSVPDEWFKPKEKNLEQAETVVRPSLSYWKDAWRRLRMNKLAMSGLVFLVLLTLFAVFAPILSPHDVSVTQYANQNLPQVPHIGLEQMKRDGMYLQGLGTGLVCLFSWGLLRL